MSENKQSSPSGHDEELFSRLFVMTVILIAGVILLMILPVLVGGFLIGLTWYGALIKDGEPNGKNLVWPTAITLTVYIYLFGLPATGYIDGVLLTDFNQWTSHIVGKALNLINEVLPQNVEIKSVTPRQVRNYFWSFIPVAILTTTALNIRGSQYGGTLFKGLNLLVAPFRVFASFGYPAVVGMIALFGVTKYFWGLPHWLSFGFGLVSIHLVSYLLIQHFRSSKPGTQSTATNLSPMRAIALGHEKENRRWKINLTPEQLGHHVHIVGASGFGKSVLLSHIIQNRILSNSGLLFVDLKADFETIRQVVSTANAAGRLNELYIFSCGNPEFSSPYNVLGYGTANQLKDRIMGALNWSEEYYKNESSSFLLKILRGLTVLRDLKGQEFDLSTVLKCAEDVKNIEAVADALPNSETEIKSQLESLSMHLNRPDNYKTLQGLRSQLESLIFSDFGHLLTLKSVNEKQIDLFDAIKNKKIIYILLDSRTYGESSRALGKLILQDLKAASARIDNEIPREKRTQFSVVVDEFADMATEDFIGFLDRARSSKIGVVVAHQEIADLSRISPEFTRRLMNSTSTLFAFLQKLPDSSELISSIAGTTKVTEVTEQAKSSWLFGDEKTGMKSLKHVDEYMIHPNVIRSLGVGECVMVGKYPKSQSAVVKVSPESQSGYLSDDEVREILQTQFVFARTESPLGANQRSNIYDSSQNEGRF